ncbi:MAG: protein kinase [Zavarzinella sp.]
MFFSELSLIAVRFVVGGAFEATGIPVNGGRAFNFIFERFNDQSQRLPKTLTWVTERAWKTLELTLAGDSIWHNITKRADDRTLAEQLRLALLNVPFDPTIEDKQAFFKQCLKEIRHLNKSKALRGAIIGASELKQHEQQMAQFTDPTSVLHAEWVSADQIARKLEEAGQQSLPRFLRFRSGEIPFLTIAVRYYFRRAIEEDRELFQGMTFARLEASQQAQENHFQQLLMVMDQHQQVLEQHLQALTELAEATHKGVLRIEDEMQSQSAENRAFYEEVLQRLDRLEIQGTEVKPNDGMSIRSEDERQKVREFLAEYRAMSESERRERPALLNAVAKLEFAAGDFEQAQEDFSILPELLLEEDDLAQAHFNSYRVALERAASSNSTSDWELALKELLCAVELNPGLMPFDMRKYLPDKILGAGGFGVTFLCRHRELEDHVAVKTLLADQMQQQADQVFAEGRLLRKIDHPAIIRMQDCGYTDPVNQQRPFLVMDYFSGHTLESYVATNGPVDLEAGLELAKILAEGMVAAHSQAVLHRDLKPANVMVRRTQGGWRAKIIDFGLALKRETVESISNASTARRKTLMGSTIAGTIDYAAPEQMGKLPGVLPGPYSDVYGWAKTVCYALFQTPNPGSRHFKEKSAPDSLRELLDSCLDDAPSYRPQSFTAVLAKLLEISHEMAPKLEVETRKSVPPPLPPKLDAPKLPPLPPPPPPVQKTTREVVQFRFFCPPEPVVRKNVLWVETSNQQELETNILKVYLNGKYWGEGSLLTGFDLKADLPPGKHMVEVAWWANKLEVDRKTFKGVFPEDGEYVIRFNFVKDLEFRLSGPKETMKKCSIEVLQRP